MMSVCCVHEDGRTTDLSVDFYIEVLGMETIDDSVCWGWGFIYHKLLFEACAAILYSKVSDNQRCRWCGPLVIIFSKKCRPSQVLKTFDESICYI